MVEDDPGAPSPSGAGLSKRAPHIQRFESARGHERGRRFNSFESADEHADRATEGTVVLLHSKCPTKKIMPISAVLWCVPDPSATAFDRCFAIGTLRHLE